MARRQRTAQAERNLWRPFNGGIALDSTEDPKPWKVLHSHYTLCVIHRGSAEWSYRGRCFSVAPGSVYVCEPGEVHQTLRVDCPGDFTAFFTDDHVFTHITEQLGLREPPHFSAAGLARSDLWTQFVAFRGLLGDPNSEAAAQRFGQLATALALSTDANARNVTPAPDTLRRAKDKLYEDFKADPTRTIRLQHVADELGIGYYPLLHGFKRCFAIAPYEYVAALRVQLAFEHLLRGPNSQCPSLTSVAQRCGYADAPHMVRAFQRHWGMPPSAVAAQLNPKWRDARKKARQPKNK